MRALILSDIHANLEALTAVLTTAAGRFDTVWNLGDTVGYGGSPNQVIDLIRPLASVTVRGNHDRVCCGLSSAVNFNPTARAAVTWTMTELTEANLTWLRDLPQGPLHPGSRQAPTEEKVLIAAGSTAATDHEAPPSTVPDLDPTALLPAVALAHGSPLHEDHYILSMRDAWAPLHQSSAPITFIGHTHLQGGFALDGHAPAAHWHELRPQFHSRADAETWTLKLSPGKRHLLNPGSVGQPRDGDWRAGFALFDTESAEIAFHRVPYDVTAAQGHILMAGLPERLAARLREGR
jgi:diadenosine tetraphosphatase ApaH/serine/threonine PP2A family protein phosphatase